MTWRNSSFVTRILWIQSVGGKNKKSKWERKTRQKSVLGKNIHHKNAKNVKMQVWISTGSRIFFHMKKSERDAFNETTSNSLGFSSKSVAMTIADQRKYQSKLTLINSEKYKNKCSVMLHQIASQPSTICSSLRLNESMILPHSKQGVLAMFHVPP